MQVALVLGLVGPLTCLPGGAAFSVRGVFVVRRVRWSSLYILKNNGLLLPGCGSDRSTRYQLYFVRCCCTVLYRLYSSLERLFSKAVLQSSCSSSFADGAYVFRPNNLSLHTSWIGQSSCLVN